MKVQTLEDDNCFKIFLFAENQEESSLLMQMSNSVRCPVESYGSIGRKQTWAWFSIPIRKGMRFKSIRFGNMKK